MVSNTQKSQENTVKANGIDIAYDTFGNPRATPLLLIHGLGQQLIHWDEEFCSQLAESGYWVIRYDNRDVGLSTSFDQAGIPNINGLFESLIKGESIKAPYYLKDMANDAVGLLDALQIPAAHIFGVSMGGMITQTVAIEHPTRALSITSTMSTTGDPSLPPPTAEAMAVLVTPAPEERAAYIDSAVVTAGVLADPDYPIDEERVRLRAGQAFDRKFNPAGFARQYAAILASGNRTEQLRSVKTPTLVMHGKEDPLVSYQAGLATLDAVSGAKLETIKGMGHDLPQKAWKQIIEAIVKHTA